MESKAETKFHIYWNRKGHIITYCRSFSIEEERDKVFETLKKYQSKTGIINLRKEK